MTTYYTDIKDRMRFAKGELVYSSYPCHPWLRILLFLLGALDVLCGNNASLRTPRHGNVGHAGLMQDVFQALLLLFGEVPLGLFFQHA